MHFKIIELDGYLLKGQTSTLGITFSSCLNRGFIGFRFRSTRPTAAFSASTSGAKDKSSGNFQRFLDVTRYFIVTDSKRNVNVFSLGIKSL